MSFRLSVPRLILGVAALIAVFAGNAYGQAVTAQPEPQAADESRLPKLFSAYTHAYFQEKVYVHTDKDSYLAGETIWMRAYRTDASTLSPYYYSGLMYIEIRDPENRMVNRMLLNSCIDSVFQATYTIPGGSPSGYYQLVAYTNWMQNYSDDFYFKKNIYVFNVSDDEVKSDISYVPNPGKNTVDVKIKVTATDGNPYKGAVLDITPYSNGGKQNLITRVASKDGEITFDYKTAGTDITALFVESKDEKTLKYQHFFKTPIIRDSIDVQFMPEGGHLLAGVAQQVGFKAVGADGKSVAVKGQVRDSLGNIAGFFESQHLGMGRFALQAQAGTSYFADVTAADGRTFTYRLPAVLESGVAVGASLRNGVLTCQVQGTPGFDYTGLFLVVHSRGRVIRWANIQAAAAMQLPVASLPEGILQCFVADQAGTVLSERVVLINKDMSPDVQVGGLRPLYNRRQKVQLDLSVLYGGNQPLPSELSVAVVDTKKGFVDKSENIVSYLTMSSDIKGKVENAAYYFDKSVPLAEREVKADLLMMTQAWKRFDVDSIFRGKPAMMPFTVEQGQYLAGKIKPLWGKSTSTGKLELLGTNPDPKTTIIDVVEADETGFFQATGIAFPRNTTFVIKGTHNGNKTNVEVTMEEQKFAGVKPNSLAGRFIYKPDTTPVDEKADFFYSRGIKYFYDQNGERVFALGNVDIVARADRGDFRKTMYDDFADNRVTGAELAGLAYTSVREYIESVGAEIRIDDNMDETVYLRNRPARLYVDELPYTTQQVLGLPVSEIEDIWVIRDPVSLSMVTLDALSDGDQSGIVIHTKGGMGISASRTKETPAFFRFKPLGYSVPAQFYSPKYDGTTNTSTNYDERVTVYWNPKIKTDADGKATVEFYTTDAVTEYLMVVQGMAGSQKMGIPVYKEITIKTGM